MIHRVIWPVIFLLGLAIGICNGLDQMAVGRSRVLVDDSLEKQAPPPEEVRQGLDVSFSLTTVSMYLGVAVGVAAIAGFIVQARQGRRRSET